MLFRAISFDYVLIGESFLRRVGQALIALERFAREISESASEASGQDGDNGSNGERAERETPVEVKGCRQKSYERETFAEHITQSRRHGNFDGRRARHQSRDQIVCSVSLEETRALPQNVAVKVLAQL